MLLHPVKRALVSSHATWGRLNLNYPPEVNTVSLPHLSDWRTTASWTLKSGAILHSSAALTQRGERVLRLKSAEMATEASRFIPTSQSVLERLRGRVLVFSFLFFPRVLLWISYASNERISRILVCCSTGPTGWLMGKKTHHEVTFNVITISQVQLVPFVKSVLIIASAPPASTHWREIKVEHDA